MSAVDDKYETARDTARRTARFTPEATVGPFFPGVFVGAMRQDLARLDPLVALHPHGQPVQLRGRVLDKLGKPVEHAILEFWQANAAGRYRHPADESDRPLDPHFDGFARVCTDRDGIYSLLTIKPGAYAARAPHLRLTLFASGVDRLYTEIFFPGEPANAADPLLMSVDDGKQRSRLVAERVAGEERQGIVVYGLDIVLRGDGETPFFDDWE